MKKREDLSLKNIPIVPSSLDSSFLSLLASGSLAIDAFHRDIIWCPSKRVGLLQNFAPSPQCILERLA
jgi:hypothetical protein